MKLAVLVFGRLEKSEESYNNIMKQLIENYDADFFCSSDNSKFINVFIEKYKPKEYINDKIDIFPEQLNTFNYNRTPETNINNVIKHFTNKKRVFEIFKNYSKKNNINYDVVISLRIDLHFDENINYIKPEENTIYIPAGEDWRNGINDQFAYGNMDVMEKYFNILDNCYSLIKIKNFKSHPETLTRANLLLNNVIIKRFNLKYHIFR